MTVNLKFHKLKSKKKKLKKLWASFNNHNLILFLLKVMYSLNLMKKNQN